MKTLFRKLAIEQGLNLGKATENESVGLLSATFLDPTFVADRSLFPPPIVELVNRVRAAHPSFSRSALSVISTPPGARIFLDGRLVGRAPCTVDLLDGERGRGWGDRWRRFARATRRDATNE